MKTVWNKIAIIGSALVFLIVAIVLLTMGKTDEITKRYEALVNKNRGRRDEVLDQEVDTTGKIEKAKAELTDIRERGDALEKKVGKSGNHDAVIDDFQKKYGN